MANVYEGPPDTRQSEEHIPVSRFRPRYRALSDEEKQLHDDIKTFAAALESQYARVSSNGRYKALALTALEESVMWIVKELTS
jgi:ribonucleotide reductase beta subunit family protein with ferritin-like domain